jgi:hypothetical protein
MGEAKRRYKSGAFRSGPSGGDDAVRDAMEAQRAAFVAKFGREPGPGDPIFFDPDADTPQPYPEARMVAEMVISMTRAGVPERLIYSYVRTGLIPVEGNEGVLSEAEKQDLRQADREYQRAFADDGRLSRRRRR